MHIHHRIVPSSICYVTGNSATRPTSPHSCNYKGNSSRQPSLVKTHNSFEKKHKQEMDVHISHRTPQTGLEGLGIIPEQPHHPRPTHARKDRPAVRLDPQQLLLIQPEQALPAVLPVRRANKCIRPRRLHGKLGQRQHRPRKNVNNNLLVNTTRRAPPMPKNPVAPKQARQKSVRRSLLAAIDILEQQAGSLVEDGEAGQVGGVLPRRFEDEPEFFAQGAGAEEEDHYEGVGEADFGAVDGAIAQGFEEGEGLVVGGVEEDVAFEGGLGCC